MMVVMKVMMVMMVVMVVMVMRAYGNNGDGRLLRWMIASITMSILVSMIMMALVTWNDECVTLCARHWSGGGGARSGTVRNRHGILCLPTCGQIWLTHTNTLDLDGRNTKHHHYTNILSFDGINTIYHHRFRDADYRSFRRARNCPELILGVWSECCNAGHQVSLWMPVLRTIWIFFVAILITILITINIVSVIVIVTTEGNADFCHFTFST